MPIRDQLESLRKDIRASESGVSIGEFLSMYKEGEIDIHPKYQRFFRWDINQKTRFIESILLGIPVPQIFVHQREDGVWDVVDGVQRLSTIYEFVGILKDELGKTKDPLVLSEPSLLTSLKDMKWLDRYDPDHSFDTTLHLYFKRAKLNVSIIMRESGESVKYELFQRLNTGGSSLSDQEVRNCILVMENQPLFEKLEEIAKFEPFVNTISISEKLQKERYDIELLLRFIVFRDIDTDKVKDVRDVNKYLTEKMIDIANDNTFDIQEEERVFKETFSLIEDRVGSENVFKKYYSQKNKFMGGFILSVYEVVAFGLGYNIKRSSGYIDRDLVCQVLSHPDYLSYSGSGKTVTQRLSKLLSLGRSVFYR
jgi:uncharacterized protein with ParB-like and HNH nuclease domain